MIVSESRRIIPETRAEERVIQRLIQLQLGGPAATYERDGFSPLALTVGEHLGSGLFRFTIIENAETFDAIFDADRLRVEGNIYVEDHEDGPRVWWYMPEQPGCAEGANHLPYLPALSRAF